jgi:signal transduction histidine kinase
VIHSEDTAEQPLVLLRWALILSLAYMILIAKSGIVTSSPSLTYVGLLLASNLLIPRIPYRNPRTFGSVLLGLDTIFVLAGVLMTDALSQDLLIGYFLCIVTAAFGDSEKRIAGAAFLVTGVYSLWIFRSWDVIGQPAFLLRLPFLFITTVFYGYMMQRVRGEHARRLQTDERARDLDCLLQVTRSFSSSLVTQEVLERVADTIKATLEAERCAIELVRGDGSESISATAAEALDRRMPVVGSESDGSARAHSVLALPIVYDVEPLGVLLIRTERPGRAFEPDEIELCQIIANAAASALKNARQYESLVEIEKAKSEFLSNLSHELRTPLNSILGFSEIAAEYASGHGDPELGTMMGRVLHGAHEMTRHVESLLRLSETTLGRERKTVGRVDLAAMLGRSLDEIRKLSKHSAIEFVLDVDPAIGEIYADGDKLQRIVANILWNAAKFTQKGTVRLSAALVQSTDESAAVALPKRLQPWERLLSLSIQDTGIGIAEKDVAKIFQEFHQAHAGSTRPYGGLGIGLTIARRLTEILGGVIRVRSRLEEGSVFQVFVPVQASVAS